MSAANQDDEGISGRYRKALIWDELTQFYSKNEEAIRKLQKLDLEAAAKDDENAQRLQAAFDGFLDTTKVVLDGLVCLGNVFPIVGGRKQQEARLQELIQNIASDITRCGSDLNSFMNRKLVLLALKSIPIHPAAKIVHAKGYEQKFAGHVANFIQRRAELQIVLTAYVAGGADVTNIAIADIAEKVDGGRQQTDDPNGVVPETEHCARRRAVRPSRPIWRVRRVLQER
ncbi:hypothetical protein CVT25_010504 [Psilocybe cyanescens]|uniref:Uncharacterized protein n=1 Tax=Psilocybe cyanescens TaxID=93625 RepID=A0A409X2M5_PSICY|nr:hypothetical protein CVT25_010504 [Psilocybe cyanescens]